MLLNFWLIDISSANFNSQKKSLDDTNFRYFNSYSNFHRNIESVPNASQKIMDEMETETETVIYTTSNPAVSLKVIMYICYGAGFVFLLFTIFLFVYAMHKCKQHNYQEIL